MRSGALVAALAVALGVAAPGCADDTCDGATADALYMTVVDATTNEPVEATLSVMRDGMAVAPECLQRHATASPCELWSAGYQMSGTFDIAVAAPGYVEARQTVTVAWTPCGPDSQTLRIPLTPM